MAYTMTPTEKAREIYEMAWQRGSTREIAIERITQALTLPEITDEEIEFEALEECSEDEFHAFVLGAKWMQKKMRGE